MSDTTNPSGTAPHGQRQDSLNDQLNDLQRLAVEHGMYDAADWMRSMRVRSRTGTTDVMASASSIHHMPDPYEAARRQAVRDEMEERSDAWPD